MTIVVSMLLSGSANASWFSIDLKDFTENRHTALACRATSSNEAWRLVNTGGYKRNPTDKTVQVTCPIPRQLALSPGGHVSVQVKGHQGASATTFENELRCWLYARSPSLARSKMFRRVTAGGFSEWLSVHNHSSASVYYLQCQIPPGGDLWSYYVEEFE